MASSSRGTSCAKPSEAVFRTQSYIQDEAFVKLVDAFKYFRKEVHFRCLTGVQMCLCPLSAKVYENATFKHIVLSSQ